ncbi:hypothetical protein H4K36_35080 [Streptomyces sp. DHE7-1]|nr:hypothetical protein [Streptomyces sp. DHE7-1]
MSKLIRRRTATGVSAVATVGALVALGGPASAASTPQAPPASARAVAADHPPARPSAGHPHIDPWVAVQLARFDPEAARRLAIYDPWVKDQLAQFPAEGK